MPSEDRRLLWFKLLYYSILCSVECGLRLRVPGCRGVCLPACFPSCRGGRTTGLVGVRVFLRSQRKGGRKGGSIRRVSVRRGPCSSSDGSRQADRRRPIRRERTKKLCRDTAIWGDVWTGSPRYRLFARRLWISAKGADPLEYAVMYRKTTVSDMAVRKAAYRRIGSPRICVWENCDRGGRLFYPSEETVGSRDGMSLHASLPAVARWREREAIRCDTTR